MNPLSLLASAVINISLAVIVLSLFSIYKKQPSNASIYYARRLSQNHHISFDHSFTISRFLPSLSWIPLAARVTEDEILQSSGLDALIVIRLLKFGTNFFSVCSLVGLVVLLPVNFHGQDEPWSFNSMDSFTISNISKGSNWLWMHFTCLWFISFYGLYLLYKEYNEILIKRIQQLRNIRHRPDQFTILVRQIPLCIEHQIRGCSVDHFFSKHYPNSYYSCQMLYEGKALQDLLNQAKHIARKIEELRKQCSSIKKHSSEHLLLGTSRENNTKIAMHEEKLLELTHKIRQLQDENMLKDKELPIAFVTFKSRWGAALAAQSQQHSNPLQWITERAPQPRDIYWRNLAISFKFLPIYKIGVILAASLLTIFFTIPVTAVQGIAKFEKLKKWFPPAMAIQLIPGLSSIVMGYLPSVILNGFIYVVPFAMFGIAKVGGSISRSKVEIKTCNMVFYFLVGNVFFLSLISGSLLEEIGESFRHPKNFPSHLARAVSAQADFFMTYILADGLSGFSLEALQAGMLLLDFIKSHTFGRGKEKNPYLYPLPYFRVIPLVSLSILIGLVYALVAPLLLPFLLGYFMLGYVVYINQIQDVYETIYDTCGQYWPYIHHYIFVGFILMQITMIGLFGLKSKPAASIATIPLLILTIMFNEYCKNRFLPTFRLYSIQNAVQNDEMDEKNGEMEVNYKRASNAYCQPSLRPINNITSESSLRQPLASSV
ncbi:CSC1-like protein At3g54510 isoform X2 [Pistacia vera]|uniref:CSC1-like protein At3g54510 isoform X2 n=1 Tax=Pistacia vera TaxID=55513 RepID=UPI001262C26D|nr:CSC1-like protein At3g54510 isoform X2 [Pistacia vera]